MKKVTFFLSVVIFLFSTGKVYSQQDAQFTQYMFNQLYINPAVAGIKEKTQIGLAFRSQWTGYNPSFDDGGSPNTTVLSFNTPFLKFNSGLGGHLVYDNLGPLTNLELQLSYAYHVKLDNAILALGIRGGIYSKIINSDFRFVDGGDPIIPDGNDSNLQPDMALGIAYHSNKMFLNLSANHLTGAEFDLAGVKQGALAMNFTIMGGYNFDLNHNWVLTPTFLVKTTELKATSFDIGSLVTYNDKFWIGALFRNEESVNALLGVNLPRKTRRKGTREYPMLKIGYSFDYVFAGQGAKQPTSHEITLSYDLPVRKPISPAKIRTPRYRESY